MLAHGSSLGFIALAALFTWAAGARAGGRRSWCRRPARPAPRAFSDRLSLSREAIAKGRRAPSCLGVVLWIIVGTISLRLAMLG